MDKRLTTQKQKIINALKVAGSEGVTNVELSKISLRYGGHLGNLYRQGYKIKKNNLDGGLFQYILISEPADIKYFQNANEQTFAAIRENVGESFATYLEKYLEEQHFHIIRRGGWYQGN
jgi:hypothetical protein